MKKQSTKINSDLVMIEVDPRKNLSRQNNNNNNWMDTQINQTTIDEINQNQSQLSTQLTNKLN